MPSRTSPTDQIAILIPTRNRPDLAIHTIESCLKQRHTGYRVIVSDNSTQPDAAAALSEFCDTHNSPVLKYVRPPQPLPMAEHWQWALAYVLDDPLHSHVAVATDRMVFYQGILAEFADVIADNPQAVITYNNDSIIDLELPYRISRRPWTGQLHRIPSHRFLKYSASMRGLYMVPKLLNCVVPRDVFERVAQRFGDYCVSRSPDYAFAYRCLTIEENVLFHDRSIVVHHAFVRSNGTSLSRGVMSVDSHDFVDSQGDNTGLTATPVPEVLVGTNAMVHEYCLVREYLGCGRLPQLDLFSYFDNLFDQVAAMENPQLQARYMTILRTEEFRLLGENRQRSAETEEGGVAEQRSLGRHAIENFRGMLKSEFTKPIWFLMADRFGVKPPNYINFGFPTFAKAMDFADRFPLPQLQHTDHLNWLLGQSEQRCEALVDVA